MIGSGRFGLIRGVCAQGLLLVFLGMAPNVWAEDEGELMAWKYHCVTCHGQTGISSAPRYPNLAGQTSAYLVSRLKYFRDEIEPRNQMNAQAVLLNDEEIDLLADYFSRQVFK